MVSEATKTKDGGRIARRRWLLGGAGVAALAAGAGIALWREDSDPEEAPETSSAPLTIDALLPLSTLKEEALTAKDVAGQMCLVNFWATWCPPCVEEMPLLDAFAQAQKAKGWLVLGIAVDRTPAVARFLSSRPVSYPIAVADGAGISLVREWGNVGGSLPYTVVFDRSGKRVRRHVGQLFEDDLKRFLKL